MLQSEKAKLQQQLQNYQKERAALEPWGDFEPESLSKLHDAGFTVTSIVVRRVAMTDLGRDL